MNPERIRRKANDQDAKVQKAELHRVLRENRLFREMLEQADRRLDELGDNKTHPVRYMVTKALENEQ